MTVKAPWSCHRDGEGSSAVSIVFWFVFFFLERETALLETFTIVSFGMFKTELPSSGLPRRLSVVKFVFNLIFFLQINPFTNLSFHFRNF